MKRMLLLAVALATVGTAQQPPAIREAYAHEMVVSGNAATDSGPITVMNIQFPAPAKLGSGEVAPDGTFAIAVKGPLTEGHGLIVIDKAGRKSARFNVAPARSGATPGEPPKK